MLFKGSKFFENTAKFIFYVNNHKIKQYFKKILVKINLKKIKLRLSFQKIKQHIKVAFYYTSIDVVIQAVSFFKELDRNIFIKVKYKKKIIIYKIE